MDGRESCTSFRSMEILSPEPPRELNIPVSSDEEEVKSSGDKKFKKSKSLEIGHRIIPTILFCSKPILITAFKIFVHFDSKTDFLDSDFLK